MAKTAQLLSNYINQKRTVQGINFSLQGDAVSRVDCGKMPPTTPGRVQNKSDAARIGLATLEVSNAQ